MLGPQCSMLQLSHHQQKGGSWVMAVLQGRAWHRDAVGEKELNCVPEKINVLWP